RCVSEYSESAQLLDLVGSPSEDVDDALDGRLRARRLVVGGGREAGHRLAQLGERPARTPQPLEDVLLRLAVFLEEGLARGSDVVDALPLGLHHAHVTEVVEELQRRVDGRRRGGRRADTLLEGVDDLRAGTGPLLQDSQDRDSHRVALPRARAFALRPPPAPPARPEGRRAEVEGPVLGVHGALMLRRSPAACPAPRRGRTPSRRLRAARREAYRRAQETFE